MTTFGVDCPPAEIAAHADVYGRLGYTRFFYGPGKPFGWGVGPLARLMPADVPVVSVKTWDETAFSAMLATSGDREWYFCFQHEPEDSIADGSLTVESLRTVYARARELVDASPSRCRLVVILNWYQLVQQGFDAKRLDGVLELADVVGVDSYSLAADAAKPKNLYTLPGDLFGPALDIAERHGIPWAVPEFAVRMASDWDRVRHARTLGRHVDWMRSHDALWASYWCHTGGAYTEHLCTSPMYRDARAVWLDALRFS